ncbi:MAG: hypothetical protein OXC30_02490 [Alphaproteobacteria bacterium]|nr:hypothetical protein [Alphaproteobacteria bacterium]
MLDTNPTKRFSERMDELLSLGRTDEVEKLWLEATFLSDPPSLDVREVYVCYLVCMNRVHEAITVVHKALQDKKTMSDKKLRAWQKAYRVLQMLNTSYEEARQIALSEHVAEDAFSDIWKTVLEKSFEHVTHWNALLVKLVCRFVPVTRSFIEKLPREFYTFVYHDQVWTKMPDDLCITIIDYLVCVGAIDGQALLRFYEQRKISHMIPDLMPNSKIPTDIAHKYCSAFESAGGDKKTKTRSSRAPINSFVGEMITGKLHFRLAL